MRATSVTTKHIRQDRERYAYQFQLEASRLGFVVEQVLSNYRYVVRDLRKGGQQYTGVIVPTSFDFYEYRLNRSKTRIDLLIVGRHNAVLPIRVVSLSQVEDFPPLAVPKIERPGAKRRNREESRLLLSKLLLNFESAWEELSQMDQRTQRRYEQRKREYLTGRIGRPWGS